MTKDELRRTIEELRSRIELAPSGEVVFDQPDVDELVRSGLGEADARRLRHAPWWDEMATDVLETGAFCSPEDPPEAVLDYARDVVSEYIWKRFERDG
jgi:hypothetical protein